MNKLFDVTRWSGLLGRFVAQNFAYMPFRAVAGTLVGYPLVNGTTKGLYDYGIKDLGWRNYKTTFKYFSLPNLAVARWLPDYTHFPIEIANGIIWKSTVGARALHEVDPYKYEHEVIDGKPANGAYEEQKKPAPQPSNNLT